MNGPPRNKTEKMEKSDRKHGQKILFIAQELELIRSLSGNEKNSRDKALKSLNKWLLTRSTTMPALTEEDFQRIWKGLYYCMWMSDKPLVQEECAEKIANLVYFPNISTSFLFFKAGLYTLIQEWSGIQQLRLDKFLMLVRRLLRHTLTVLKNNKYTESDIHVFNDILTDTVLNKSSNTPMGLFMHFVEIFMEELAKVSRGKLQPSQILEFTRPFIRCLATSDDGRKTGHIRKFIFIYLIKQSKLGLEYDEKYRAWRQQGFPGSINSMQKLKIDRDEIENENSDDEVEKPANKKEKSLDPRAGRVDVEIPLLHFKPKEIAKALLEYKRHPERSTLSRPLIIKLIEQFTSLANGTYPLGIKKIDVKDKNEAINIRKAANRLIKFDQKILGKKSKKRKHDKENNEEVIEKKRKKIGIDEQDTSKSDEKVRKRKRKSDHKITEHDDIFHKEKKMKKKTKLKETDESKPKKHSKTLTLNNDNTDKKVKKKIKSKIHPDEESEHSKKTKSKLRTILENNKVKSDIVKAKNKVKTKELQIKIQPTDKKNKKAKKSKSSNEHIECIFERNSGTWVVYEVKKNSQKNIDKNISNYNGDSSHTKSPKKHGKNIFEESGVLGKDQLSLNQSSDGKLMNCSVLLEDSSKLGMVPVKLFESPPKEKEIFPKSAWDEPLQEGEYEICIPSKSHIKKMKKESKKLNKSVHELINTTPVFKKIKGKSRLSLDSRLINNPYSKSSSAKKVKINTKLNKSQEVHEHYSRLRLSPGIPFDANRKPSKPLLKPTAVSTPINPFYKKQLNI